MNFPPDDPLEFISDLDDVDITGLADGDSLVYDSASSTYKPVNILAAADALVYQGVIDCSGSPNYPAADSGHVYKVSVAGKIGGASGINVEVGDMPICNVDSSASGDEATVGANWNIIQVNIDGAVIGPASSTDHAFARFDLATGKLIQDSVVIADDSGNMSGVGTLGVGGDITTAQAIGRDTDNEINWGTDNSLAIAINGTTHDIVSITDGASDNDKLVTQGYVDDSVNEWLIPPMNDFYDPTGGLPVGPSVGDRYVSEATANGWTENYVYEWDGAAWVESAPEEGWMFWDLLGLLYYVFFSGGWMEVGDNSYLMLDGSNANSNIDIATYDLITTGAVGRDTDNEINWGTDNSLAIAINGTTHNIVSISDGAADNDKLATQGYVDDSVPGAGATAALDNLASVAINTSLIPDTDTTHDLGSTTKTWQNAFFKDADGISFSARQFAGLHRDYAEEAAMTPYSIGSAVSGGTWTITLTDTGGDGFIRFALDDKALESPAATMTVDATALAGTDAAPETVYVYVENNGSDVPILVASRTNPDAGAGITHAHVANYKAGAVTASAVTVYGKADAVVEMYKTASNIYHRIFSEGALYQSGLDVTATTSNVTIATGAYQVIFDSITSAEVVVGTDGLFYIKNDNSYNTGTDFSFGGEYGDGVAISDGKSFNVVLGVMEDDTTRIMALVQTGTTEQYRDFNKAFEDKKNQTIYQPSDSFLKSIFVPVARIIVDRTGATYSLEQFDDGKYYQDLRGTKGSAGGSSPGAGASVSLDNLVTTAINTSLVSDTDNTDALGTTAIAWSDLFLGNESVITWSTAPSTADVTLTHAANALTFAGGAIDVDGAFTAGSVVSDAGVTGTVGTFSAASSLVLGTGSSAAGGIIMNNATNGNTVTIQSGVTSGTYTLTLPLAVAGAGEVLTDAAGDGVLSWASAGGGGATTELDNLGTVAINTTLASDTDNTDALGTAPIGWSDLFLGNESVITWSTAPSTADLTLTHSANTLTLAGGALAMDNAAGATIVDEAATSTNPTLIPNKADPNTGIGWSTTDTVSLIAGGAEMFSAHEKGTSGNTMVVRGGTLTAGDVDDRSLQVEATLNDAGAAGGTDLFNLIKGNVTASNVTGWDIINLMDLQVSTVSKFKVDSTGAVTAVGGITANVTGDCTGSSGSCTGESATVATITTLAPDTATTQATQASITTCANLVEVGALNAGSITSGFTSIDTGAGNIITTGTIGASGGDIANGVTATTQSSGDNSTKVATTAYVNEAASKIVVLKIIDDATELPTAGDDKMKFTVPIELTGMNLVSVGAHVYTASDGGTAINVQIYNETDSSDMLSTAITIDNTETDSSTAATPAVINTGEDDVVTADVLRIDLDQIGANAAGLEIRLGFKLP